MSKKTLIYKDIELYRDLECHLMSLKDHVITSFSDYKYSNISSLTGCSGRLVFLACLMQSYPENNYTEAIEEEVRQIIGYINNNEVSPRYVDGLAGFGSSISYLCNLGVINLKENDLLSDLDIFLFECAKQDLNTGNYDFFYGAIGYATYLTQRLSARQNLFDSLQYITNSLLEQRKRNGDYLIWQSKTDEKNCEIDFSLSHGLSSIINFLIKMYLNNICTASSRDAIINCCNYFLSNIRNISGSIRIPDYIKEDAHNYSPLRWCHGELGIIYTLLKAGKALNNVRFINSGLDLAISISKFRLDESQSLYSSTVCHGTIGVAHIFLKIYHFFPDNPELEQAVLYWYKKSNELLKSSIGYKYFDDDRVFREKEGILNGVEGIGLCLLSALKQQRNNWDSMILLG